MINPRIYAVIIFAVITILILLYRLRYRHLLLDVFEPNAAWLRAGIYFCGCYLVAIMTGVFKRLFLSPIAATEQISDAAWWVWVIGLILLVTVAYWGIWAR